MSIFHFSFIHHGFVLTLRRSFLSILLCLLLAVAQADDNPNFSLANTYSVDESLSLADYWMSEKYDGARAWWDGARLISRGGNVYAAPAWFTDGLPTVQLDGELWIGRGQFEKTMSIIRKSKPHERWRDIRYMVFDLPAHRGIFRERYAAMLMLKSTSDHRYWQVVEQSPIESAAALERYHTAVLAAGGEGIMLRRIESYHRGGRSDDLLKYKSFTDAEAVVIGYNAGKGKYTGMVGSLRLRANNGIEFSVGSGLTDAMRKQPPPIGTTITYKYQGLTNSGKPRFPVFLRVRNDEPER